MAHTRSPLHPWRRQLALCATLALAVGLSACTSVRTIDSAVQSFSTLQQLPSPPTYRLQLLPSQLAQGAAFGTVVEQAQASLAGVGLQRDDAGGSLVAQISAQARYIPDSWLLPGSPYYPWGPGYGWGPYGWRPGGLMWRDTGPSLHVRAVKLTLRDFASQQVVYETSAHYEDVWVDDHVIYRILFDSALNGFPTPPAGPRRVSTTLGAPAAPAAPVAPATPMPAAPAVAPVQPPVQVVPGPAAARP